jgi:glyoxylase-like metal-dependent hydrolase (beta-lactamase superfamily II)
MFSANNQDSFGDFSITTVINTPPWYENCYVVRHRPTGRQLVIDPGGEADRIAAVVTAGGGGADGILLTHGHPDHLGGVHDLQTVFDVPCRAHREEQPVIASVASWAGALMRQRIPAPRRLEYFTDEPVLAYDGFEVRVVFTPGHTPGGVCYVFDGFVFTGDTLFNRGVGRTDLPGGHGPTLAASIGRLLETLTPSARLYSGHGPAWTVAEARAWWAHAADYDFG